MKKLIVAGGNKLNGEVYIAGAKNAAIHCKDSDPIHKATIIPRVRALDLVMRLSENDRFSVTRAKLHDYLIFGMGVRAAEELIFGYDRSLPAHLLIFLMLLIWLGIW
tara:strand:+ start:2999 stop:3319 length:321 start_codon:yes stop_codon:yes gene_type:complete